MFSPFLNDRALERSGVLVNCVKLSRVQDSTWGCFSISIPICDPPTAALTVWPGSWWSSSSVSVLTAGTQPRLTQCYGRACSSQCSRMLGTPPALTPLEFWWPSCFHRLLLLGPLLSLLCISLTLGSQAKKFSLLHLLSLRNWKGFMLNSWCPCPCQNPKAQICHVPTAPGEVVWTHSEMTLNLCSTLRWQVLSLPTTPQHTCFLSNQEVFYWFFFFPFHFFYHPSSWTLPTYPFPITSLLEN